jgi:hypothetical protein
MSSTHEASQASGAYRGLRLALLAMHCLGMATAASAQGVSPGELSREGDKLPGGFEPVLHLRTYYFESESTKGSPTAASALGGWAGLRSPWLGDIFQVGLVGYTSQKLYGPADKDGTKLLAPGQEAITVLGEAYAAARLFGQTITGYRQLINRPFITPQDSRMVPNTFEAYTLTGSANEFSYTGGYIAKIKSRNSENFEWMSTAAGGNGNQEGVSFAGLTWAFAKNGYLRADMHYGTDVFRTSYVDGKYPIAFDEKTSLTLGAQYIAQESVGNAQIGPFSTHAAGLQVALDHGPVGAKLSYTQTDKGYTTQNPYGDHPSYLGSMQVDFNTAGERAWGVGVNLNLVSLGAPGLTASAAYNSGQDRIDAKTSAALPNRNETDTRVDYAFGKGTALSGLVATLRYSLLHEDGAAQNANQLRAYLNFPFDF